jgi:RNA polymerase sigma-70 factor, ECF subfamily
VEFCVPKREVGNLTQRLTVTRVEVQARAFVGLANADDEALARALIAKDPGAAAVAWERFTPLVRRILRRALGPAQNAEDLVQEVFLRLFLKAHELREPRALRAFLISIATLTVRSELRRLRARSWLGFSPDVAGLDLRVVHPDPSGRQAIWRFYELLDRFNSRDRMAYVLRFIEGMSLTQVSEALGVSLSTTKRSLLRVRRRLLELVRRDALLADYVTDVPDEPDDE